jgi:hypothetical protein
VLEGLLDMLVLQSLEQHVYMEASFIIEPLYAPGARATPDGAVRGWRERAPSPA